MDFKGMFQTWLKVLSSPGQEVFVPYARPTSSREDIYCPTVNRKD